MQIGPRGGASILEGFFKPLPKGTKGLDAKFDTCTELLSSGGRWLCLDFVGCVEFVAPPGSVSGSTNTTAVI